MGVDKFADIIREESSSDTVALLRLRSSIPSFRVVWADFSTAFKIFDNLPDAFFHALLASHDDDFCVVWDLVGGRYAGEIANFAPPRLRIQPLDITLLAHT